MEDSSAFFLDAIFDVKKMGGFLCRLLVYCDYPIKKRMVDEAIQSGLKRVTWSYTALPRHSIFVMHCENIAEEDATSGWVTNLDGITDVRMRIIEKQFAVRRWIDEEIATRLS